MTPVHDVGGPTIAAVLRDAASRLEAAGWDSRDASLEVEVLARFVLGWDRARLVEEHFAPPPAGVATALGALVQRRLGREPVAYITGTREFWGRDFRVTPAVLIPRPETEIIIEKALELFRPASRPWWLADAGTGSGCLAVTLCCELPHTQVIATDVSAAALAVAAVNARNHAVDARARFVRTTWLDGLTGPFDGIVANPPYVPLADRFSLQRDVVEFEPAGALFGGADGLDAIRVLLGQSEARLAPGGWLLMEIGFGQADAVRREVERTGGLMLVEIARDLQGCERTLVARKRGG
jgi:release factor glutamine methyltransferase